MPGLVAVILQTPAPIILTVRLLTSEQTLGVSEVVVVTPAVWLMFKAMSGLPKVTLAGVAKLITVVGSVTAWD